MTLVSPPRLPSGHVESSLDDSVQETFPPPALCRIPGEEQPVVEDNGDTDGDIPAEALETDDEINSNINREIPAATSETDDGMEAEEMPVDQGDHLQGPEDVTPDEDVQEAQMPEDVPANLRRSTRHSQRTDRWGHNIYDL